MFESEYQERFGESSEHSRRSLAAMAMLAINEAGLKHSYPFLADRPCLDLKGIETDIDLGEFSIIENGDYVRGCIDDQLPTIAVATHTFTGQMELIAANLANPNRHINILGLVDDSFSHLSVIEHELYANHGFIVKSDGSIIFGGFSNPVKISGLEEADLMPDSRDTLLRNTNCRLFSGGNQTEFFRDKSLAKEKFKDFNIPFVPGVTYSGTQDIPALIRFLQTEIHAGKDLVVVKPAKEQSGRGVAFYRTIDKKATINHVQQIFDSGQNAVIEKFIEPFAITDKDGGNLWSNIRAASIGCMSEKSLPLLMHARVGEAGKPSNVFCGAEAKSIEWLMKKAQEGGLNPDRILSDILKSQNAIRATGVKTFGADYIIDDHGDVYLIEVNTTYFGAIQFKDIGPAQLEARVKRTSNLLPYLGL